MKKLPATLSAAVVACAVTFTPVWEGMDVVAKKDMIGTGHPVTYCYGQTSEYGVVREGTRFTKQQCDQLLAKSLPKYLDEITQCVVVDLPAKTWTSLLDAAYNAGSRAVCRSPMVAKFNAGNFEGGCEAFKGWYIRSAGQVRRGLIARRSGIDSRKSELQLCHEGLQEGKTKKSLWATWRS